MLAYGSKHPSGKADAPAAAAAESDLPRGIPQTVVLSPLTARLGEDDKEALRSLIREELRAAQASASTGEAGTRDPETLAKELPEAELASYSRAHSMVEQALHGRSWREADREELRPLLAGLPQELFQQIVLPLIAAANKGEVHWDGRGPLF